MLWDNEVGRLSWDRNRGISFFEYNWEFLDGNLDIFPIIASIKSPSSRLPIMGDRGKSISSKLPPFIADSLPDTWGNQVFECWRIEKGIRNSDITPLDILSFIGKRAIGALEFIPDTSPRKKSELLNLQSLSELAQRIFIERENATIRPDESLTMQSLIAVGTSAGGRQPKVLVAINSQTGEIRSGQIAGQKDFEHYILKFGDSERSSAELEMTYYEMAVKSGIQMMPSNLIDIEGNKHFITRRFDRDKDRKLHVQTLAALYPEADSYEKLLMVCRKMRLPESTSEEIYRRMIFNILANNTDDHNKNFSFLMDEKGRWSLSPAYDMTYIFNTGGFLPETHHCLLMNGKVSGYTIDDARAFAKNNGIRKADTIIRAVADAVIQFRNIAEKNGVHEKWISAVETCISTHLEEWGLNSLPKGHFSFKIEGIEFTDVHIEQTYKGNYHLCATINGKKRKYVITPSREEYSLIASTRTLNLNEDCLKELVSKHFK